MRKTVLLFASVLMLGACAKNSNEIPATHVSAVAYDSYNCKKLQMEAIRLSRRTAELQFLVDDNAEGDEGAAALGIILFWPALFFIDGDTPQTYEYARLKGEMNAVEMASIQKECGFKVVRPPARKPKSNDWK